MRRRQRIRSSPSPHQPQPGERTATALVHGGGGAARAPPVEPLKRSISHAAMLKENKQRDLPLSCHNRSNTRRTALLISRPGGSSASSAEWQTKPIACFIVKSKHASLSPTERRNTPLSPRSAAAPRDARGSSGTLYRKRDTQRGRKGSMIEGAEASENRIFRNPPVGCPVQLMAEAQACRRSPARLREHAAGISSRRLADSVRSFRSFLVLRVARTQVTCDVVARGVVHAAQETCITIINIQPVEDIMHAGFRGLSRRRFLSGRVGIF